MRQSLRGGLSIVLAAAAAWAQEFRSTVSGRITDAQDAVIGAVKIEAVLIETGARSETVSSADGQFTLPFLSPGAYRITAEAPGFKRYAREGLQVSTNERQQLDIKLELGAIAETVTVTAESPMLQTSTASTGQVINSRQIESMPMLGRTPLVLAQLAFGVIPSSDPRFYRPFDNAGPSTFSMGGAPARTNELLIDGAPDTTQNARVAYNPPVDAVAEVKVETFQADAAYGHSGGGTVNVVMKSGTNSLHGSAYEFNQVSATAAAPFFTNRAGLRKQVTRFNQYGVNAGGPITIPKLINGRNRVFFYFAWEGLEDSIPAPTTGTAPTAAQRAGDFSSLLAVGPNYQIYDPLTGVRQGTRIARQPFARNVIPPGRINGIARNYLQYLPTPNQTGRADGQDNFLSNTNGEHNKFTSELGRLDLNLSSRHKLFYNFRYNERLGDGGNNVGRALTDVTATNGLRRTNLGTMVDDVYTITPTTVLNTRLNWTRFTEANRNFSVGFDQRTLGFPAALSTAAGKALLPRVSFDRFTGVGDVAGKDNPFDIFQIFSSVTRIVGKHSLKIGGDLRMLRESNFDAGFASGAYSFGSAWTRGPLDNSTAAPLGQDFASFLLGLPTGGGFDVNAARTNQAGYMAFFVQDDFRYRPNLTFNLGLRYERDQGTTERFDRSVNGFDSSAANPIGAAAAAAYNRNPIAEIAAGQFRTPGGLLFASPQNHSIYQTRTRYFSPRLGIAWSPWVMGAKAVVRGGAGVFVFPVETTGVNQVGFSNTTSLVSSLDGLLTPYATLTNPFPLGIETPSGASRGLSTFLGRSFSYFNPTPLNPYAFRWHLNLQRELARNLVLEMGYVGNHAVHLDLNRQLDYIPRQYLSTSPTRDQAAIDRLTANVTNPFAGLIPGQGLSGTTAGRAQLLRPYPQFTGVTLQYDNGGSSYFHMFQVRVEKRFSQGLEFLANYQFSKLLEKRSRLNDSDPNLEKRIADEDRPQRLVFSTNVELPFGRGKKWANTAHPVLARVAGGWVFNGIYTVQPGGPLGWGNLIYLGGSLNPNMRNIDAAFDVTRFVTSSSQQLDQNIRVFPTRFANVRADGPNNLDFSILKNTQINEHVRLQYRCEFFNAMNHPTFNPPNLSATSSGFGKATSQGNLPRRIQMALRLVW